MDENDAARTSVAAARDKTIIISDDEAEESSSSKGQPQAIFISDDENETSGEGENNREHDDENDDDSICSAEERDVQFYDDTLPDEEDADFIPDNIDDHADNTDVEMLDYTPPAFVPPPIHFERAAVRLASGSIIAPGNTVELELEDEPTPIANRVQSGDFILVRSILETTEDGLITVRGYRMRRTRYLAPQFDSKLNDLFMNLTVKLNSPLSRFEQGLEDIPLEQVKCKRDCVFTRLDSRSYNSINITRHIPARLRSRQEIRNWLFRRGKLVCRYVNIVELERTDKSYGGEARLLHKREVEAFQNNMPYSPTAAPNKPRPSIRSGRHLTFGDGFSGCGGASEGARQAGFIIKWALERDEQAMAAYRKNFPSATHLHMDAVDFPRIAQRAKHGCDHLHISCPCQPWSCMQYVFPHLSIFMN
jgi:DNA (cytosine-5)-methyltransferase 1